MIPPNQKVVKYIAIPALSDKNDGFSVSLVSGKKATQFNFTQKIQKETHEYLRFRIQPKMIFAKADLFSVLETNGDFIPLRDNLIIIRKDSVDSPVSVFCICNWEREFELGIREDFKLSECKNSTVTTKVYYFKAFKKSELGQ